MRNICIEKVLKHHEEHNHAKSAVGRKRNNWSAGQTIRYAFIGGNQNQIDKVIEQLNLVESFVNLIFELVTDLNQSDVRASFDEDGGAWSYIGKDALTIPKNRATMNFGFMDGGTIPHEIGHMLGLEHEQQFPDWLVFNESVIIADMKRYGWTEEMTRHNILNKIDHHSVNTTEHADPKSVMMYWIDPRWVKSPSNFQPRNNVTWSDKDIEFLMNKYPYPEEEFEHPTEEKCKKAYTTLRQSESFGRLPKRATQAMLNGFTAEEDIYHAALVNFLLSEFNLRKYFYKINEKTLLEMLKHLGHEYTDKLTKRDLYKLFHKALDISLD